MNYRAEIDGLRALAVVPVILFHAGFEVFSGGFVGVDVFFVISGYLITTILIEDLEKQKFSILEFYERRARRILPALFFVMGVCIPLAWMWMLPLQMQDFSRSLIAVSVFLSNFLFWQESGYFDAAAEEKPLLHTWSLAVEEQYYVLFPLLLLAIWRFGKNRVFYAVLITALGSFILSEFGWRDKPTANFYLPFTRAWELLLGSISAFIVQKRGVKANNLYSALGICAIVVAIFAYDESTPFPGVYALLPVGGVVLLVLYAGQGTLVAKILSLKIFVGVGLISYSAYLWHQPLFAFARILSIDNPSAFLMGFLSLASMALAFFSWKYVEKPFRKKNSISKSRVYLYSGIGLVAFALIGALGHITKGYEKVLSTEKTLDKLTYVIGDSHAWHLLFGLRAINKQKVVQMTSAGCIPFRDVDRYDSRFEVGSCADTMNAHLDKLGKIESEAIVIISSMGPVYLDGTTFMGKDPARVHEMGVDLVTNLAITDHYEIYEIGLRQTLTELQRNTNLEIVFTIDIPEIGIDKGCGGNPKELNAFGIQLSDFTHVTNLPLEACRVKRSVYDERVVNYKNLVTNILSDYPDVTLFDPTDIFCDTNDCYGFDDKFGYLYRDVDHLSKSGSLYYAEKLSEYIAKE